MSGRSTQLDYYYQNCVGVLRTLQLTGDNELEYIEFESTDEELEDIRLVYTNHEELERVKKRGDKLWFPSDLPEIFG